MDVHKEALQADKKRKSCERVKSIECVQLQSGRNGQAKARAAAVKEKLKGSSIQRSPTASLSNNRVKAMIILSRLSL